MRAAAPTSIWRAVRRCAPADGVEWLERATAEGSRAAVRVAFPAAGRRLGRALLDTGETDGILAGWTVEDGGRALLLLSLGADADPEAVDLYRLGSAAERRGVLRALDVLPPSAAGLALVQDALRTNDPDLIAAALGPFGMGHLDDDAAAHAILKCVFSGIPLHRVHAADQRASPQLSRMLAEYAHERVVAGRPVPPEIWPLVNRFPPQEVLEQISRERRSPFEDRRIAAKNALASSTTTLRTGP